MQCQPIRTFGKRHLDDVLEEVNPVEAVAPWCSMDTSSGSITVTLDPFNCFDAEVYADELELENAADFREDQRSKCCAPLETRSGPLLTASLHPSQPWQMDHPIPLRRSD